MSYAIQRRLVSQHPLSAWNEVWHRIAYELSSTENFFKYIVYLIPKFKLKFNT